MFDTQPPIDDLSPEETLAHAAAMQAAAQRCEVAVIEAAAHWADLHGVLERSADSPALPGTEELVQLGGNGTPEVAEFCPAELGAELGMSTYATFRLIGDALDLRHRLPLVWSRVRDGEIAPWIGRRVAEQSRPLSLEAVADVDRRVARWGHALTWARLRSIVQSALIEADPEAAQEAADKAQTECGVWLGRDNDHGTLTAFVRAEAPDLLRFDDSLSTVAAGLRRLGDDSSVDVRRARALGVLADPQQALDLLAPDPRAGGQEQPAHSVDAIAATSGEPEASGRSPVHRGGARQTRPQATIVLHLGPDALTPDATGVARLEDAGPVLLSQAKRWLGHCHVTVRPVLDPAGLSPVDAYEVPDRMREAVHILSPADVFPYASSTSHRQDLDHTDPYVAPDDGGPPGQTRIGNLGPMTRRHHRIKTHGPWQVQQPYPGIHVWRSPHGRYYLVDHTGTRKIPRAA